MACCSSKVRVLHEAASAGDVETVKAILQQVPLLGIRKGMGGLLDTAWHLAAANGHLEVLEALYKHAQEHCDQLGVHLRRKQAVHSADQILKAVVNTVNVKHQTPLMFACYAGHAQCVEALLRMGANPWLQDKIGSKAALHYAAMKGHTACLVAVLEHSGRSLSRQTTGPQQQGSRTTLVNQKTVYGLTALHFAAISKVPGACQALLDKGAALCPVTAQDCLHDTVHCPRGTTPLHLAAGAGFEEGVKEILKHYLTHRESTRVRDPRMYADRAKRLPYHLAGLLGYQELSGLLRPALDLTTVFPPEEVEEVGVPSLAVLAAKVLKQALLLGVDSADAKISELEASQGPAGEVIKPIKSSRSLFLKELVLTPNMLATVEELDASINGRTPMHAGTASPPSTAKQSPPATSPPSLHMQSKARTSFTAMLRSVSSRRSGTQASQGLDSPRPYAAVTVVASGTAAGSPARHGAAGDDTQADGVQEAAQVKQGPHITLDSLDTEWWDPDATLQGSMLTQLLDAPTPRPASFARAPSLMQRMRSVGASSRLQGSAWDAGAGLLFPQTPSLRGSGVGSMRLGGGGRASAAWRDLAGVTEGLGEQDSALMWRQQSRAMGSMIRSACTPFAGWGTDAMISSIPHHDTCTVCLDDDVIPAVLVPCLHRLCIPCTRQMVMTIKDKPLGCPACRTNIMACFAPNDVSSLKEALLLK